MIYSVKMEVFAVNQQPTSELLNRDELLVASRARPAAP